MSISSEVRKAGPFAGNGVATAFPFAFKVFSAADVLVVFSDASGSESELVLGTDYTVSLNADQNASPGGTVTLSTALATGQKLVLSSQVALLQPVDLTNSGGFYPKVINDALDRVTIQIQQVEEKVTRAWKIPISSDATSADQLMEDVYQAATDAIEAAERVDLGALDEAVTTSTSNAAVTVAQNTAAQIARAAAEAARDAATVNANVYTSISAGIAAVADGVQFQVVSADGMAINRYRRDSSSAATLMATYPSEPAISSKFEAVFSTSADDIWAVLDSGGRVLLRITKDGTVSGKIASSELTSARGSRVSLDARLSQSISAYGMPRQHVWGEWYLRETRQRLRLRALGEAAQLVVASIGDSWTHNTARWCGPTASSLKTAFGDAGAGYVSFARSGASLPNGNVVSTAAVTYTGTWDVSAYVTNTSPDLGAATSSTAGDKLSYTIAASPSAVRLFAQGAAGVVRYRFNAGSWVTVDLSALSAGLQVVDLPTPVAGVFEIEVVSGAPVLHGIDVRTAANGVRWHKLGATGSRASQWAAVDATQWQSGMQALAPNLVVIMLATNDQAAYDAATYKGHMQTLITRVKTALPLADILLVVPCENGRANTWPMSDYAAAAHELAAVNKCAFLDLQYVFGETFSEYASTSARAWFNADTVHPEPSTGGRAIVDAVYRLITTL